MKITARKIEHDIHYLKHRSLVLDFIILKKTIRTIF